MFHITNKIVVSGAADILCYVLLVYYGIVHNTQTASSCLQLYLSLCCTACFIGKRGKHNLVFFADQQLLA